MNASRPLLQPPASMQSFQRERELKAHALKLAHTISSPLGRGARGEGLLIK